MEQSGSLGTWIAQGVIALFVLLLAALFIRTALMVGSVFLLAWTRRGDKPTGEEDDRPQP